MDKLNPIKAWGNLPKNGKIALVVGLAIIAAYFMYKRKKTANDATTSASDNATSDNTDSSSSDSGSTDPYASSNYGGQDSSLDPTGEYDYAGAYGAGSGGDLAGYGPSGGYGGGSMGMGAMGNGQTSSSGNSADPYETGAAIFAAGEAVGSSASSTTGGGMPVRPDPGVAHSAPKGIKSGGAHPSTKGKVTTRKTTVPHTSNEHHAQTHHKAPATHKPRR